jgi:diguanylate cyclase (GGDEF)-like protein/PAS domain S-box-containing protein
MSMHTDELNGIKKELAECRQAEEMLQLTKFSLDHAAIAAYLIDKEARFLYVNEQGCLALGYSREELLAMTVAEIDPDFPMERWAAHWAELKREGSLHFETNHRRKDGRLFPVDVIINYLEYGGREYNWAFARDISARLAAENELKRSYRLTRTILDSMNDAVSLIDVESFRIRGVNRVFLEEYGLADQAEVEGKFCFEVTHRRADVCAPPDDICPLAETLKTGNHSSAEHVHYGRRGEKIYVEVSTSPIKDEQGKVVQVVHVARNITERKLAENALRRSEQRFRDIAAHAGEWIWEMDAVGRYTYASPVVEKILGYTSEEVCGRYFHDFFPPASKEELTRKFFAVFARQKAFRDLEYLNMDREGRTIILATSGVPILSEEGGQLVGYRGVDRDITLRRQAEDELRVSESRFRSFFEESSLSMQIFAPGGQCLEVNRAFEKLWGMKSAEVGTYNLLEDPQLEAKGIAPYIRKGFGGEATEIPAVRYDPGEIGLGGRPRWVSSFIYPVKNRKGAVREVVLTHLDVTEQKEMEEIIRQQAFHDALTGLPNRRLFVDILNLELARAKRHGSKFAVLFLDLDRFKDVNDAFGHAIGDELLKEAAARLKQGVREVDSVARIGGDEFTILLSGMPRSDSIGAIAGKIVDSLRQPFVLDGHELRVATSIGISIYPEDAQEPEVLLRKADVAMYKAKERGGNSYEFSDPLRA